MCKIEVKGLDLFYDDFQALKDVNMKIREQQITAFIGPSGCGKSTLIKTLNRMNDLISSCRITGSVTLDGEDVFTETWTSTCFANAWAWCSRNPTRFP